MANREKRSRHQKIIEKMCCFLKMGNVAMKEIHLSKLVLFCTEIRFCFYIKYKFGFTLNSLSSTLYNTYLIFAFLILYCEYRYTYPTARRSPKRWWLWARMGWYMSNKSLFTFWCKTIFTANLKHRMVLMLKFIYFWLKVKCEFWWKAKF